MNFSVKNLSFSVPAIRIMLRSLTATFVKRLFAQMEAESAELVNDLELVAVITAAIASFAGATPTDGFVVRSIRKVRR